MDFGFDIFGGLFGFGLSSFIARLGYILFIPVAIGITLYVFAAIGLYNISKRRKVSEPILAWIPIASSWILGSLADQYIKATTKTDGLYRHFVLWFDVARYASLFFFPVLFFPLNITYYVFKYIALYKLYVSCRGIPSGGYLALSIIFFPAATEIVTPFLIFSLKDKDLGMPRPQVQPPVQSGQPKFEQSSRPSRQSASSAVLVGKKGEFANQKFSLSSGKLIIGRDPSVCNIIFKEGTPGISSNHCQVWFDSAQKCFFLKDNGSTYGTYLVNGVRLPPSVPQRLNAGESFYPATGDIVFSVSFE